MYYMTTIKCHTVLFLVRLFVQQQLQPLLTV